MRELEIIGMDIRPLKVPMVDDFKDAKDALTETDGILIKLTLRNGITGYGEVAPFKSITGEDIFSSRKVLLQLGEMLKGHPAVRYREISTFMMEKAAPNPGARGGLEMAILDAVCRSFHTPLWIFLGGRQPDGLSTGVTIPTLSLERSLELAAHWNALNFKTLKIEVGVNIDFEINLIQQIHEAHPHIKFILDANQGFTEEESILFIKEISAAGCEVLLFEQPVERDDLEGMKRIRKHTPIPIAADESVFTLEDVQNVIKRQAADIVNLKIMKSGLIQTLDIATTAHTMGLKLMIGGMLETRLGMGCSLAIAAGLGTIKYLDLDTPLLLSQDPFEGGYRYEGPNLHLYDQPGLGIKPKYF